MNKLIIVLALFLCSCSTPDRPAPVLTIDPGVYQFLYLKPAVLKDGRITNELR